MVMKVLNRRDQSVYFKRDRFRTKINSNENFPSRAYRVKIRSDSNLSLSVKYFLSLFYICKIQHYAGSSNKEFRYLRKQRS